MQRSKKVFRPIATGFLLVVAAFVGLQFYRAVNAEAFNLALQRKVESNQLIGKSERDVIAVLGTPSSRVVYRDGDFTLNYFPGVIVPFNKFQAHFRASGTLRSIELMD